MRTQLFVGCHYFDGRTDNLYAFARDFLKSYFTDKAIQTHSAISFGITVCGQRMIGSRCVIACTLRRQGTQKYRACIDNTLGLLLIIPGFDYQVFGSIFIG